MLRRLFGNDAWSLDDVRPPWPEGASVFDHLDRAHSSGEHTLLENLDLPDEASLRSEAGIGWAAGALDGVFGHQGEDAAEGVEAVSNALQALLEKANDSNAHLLFSALLARRALGYVDGLMEDLSGRDQLNLTRLQAVARWLLKGSPSREPVKIAISLLGGTRDEEALSAIELLGRHSEFTLFAAVAIENIGSDSERRLWRLAQQVKGWGRIHLIERLAESKNEHIQAWMLREGFRNSIMDEYTGLICAQSGRLAEALALEDPDDDLIRGAGGILGAIVVGRGGPAAGIESYPQGPVVFKHYLRHLQARSLDLEQFVLLRGLRSFLTSDDEVLHEDSWNACRTELLEQIDQLLKTRDWTSLVNRDLGSTNSVRFHTAIAAADLLGLDIWETHFSRLRSDPGSWFHVMQTDDRERAAKVVEHAVATLPLDAISTGPGEALGLGPDFQPHSALDFVLQGLGEFPGLGWTLVEVGLRSPVIRNRNLAVKALTSWGPEHWPEEAEAALRSAVANEPVEDTRIAMEAILGKE